MTKANAMNDAIRGRMQPEATPRLPDPATEPKAKPKPQSIDAGAGSRGGPVGHPPSMDDMIRKSIRRTHDED